MASFDVQGAKKAGYSDAEIADYMASQSKFDAAGARKAGYSDTDIIGHLSSAPPAPATRPAARAAPQEKPGIGDRIGRAFTTAVDRVKTDMTTAPKVGETRNYIGHAANILLAPVNEAYEAAVVEPTANVLAKIPAQAYGNPTLSGPGRPLTSDQTRGMWAGAVRKGLMAMGPGPSGRAPVPAVRGNALADTVQAFDRAGVTPDLATASRRGGAARVSSAVGENPIAGIAVRARARARVGEVSSSADRIGSQYGTATSRGAAGERVQAGVGAYNQRFSARSTHLYDNAFDTIDRQMAGKTQPGVSQIQTPTTSSALNQMLNGVQSKSLKTLLADPDIQRVADSLTGAQGAADLSFHDLRALRTWVRNAKGNPELRQSIGEANLRRLESALTDDLYTNAATLASPQAAARLKRVDQFYRLGNERIDGALQNFVGRGAYPKSGENTYDLVMRAASDRGGADIARLSALKKSLQPDEWGEVAATTIDRMGAPTPGAAEAGDFSVGRFVTNYSAMSDRGRNIMFGSGAIRRELDNLVNVAGMVKRVEKTANTSNTGSSLQALGTVGGLANPATTIPTAKLLAGLSLTGEAMTNPAVVRWVAKLGSAKSPQMLSTTVQQLQQAARANAALLPLSEQAQLFLEAPRIATKAVANTEQQQDK